MNFCRTPANKINRPRQPIKMEPVGLKPFKRGKNSSLLSGTTDDFGKMMCHGFTSADATSNLSLQPESLMQQQYTKSMYRRLDL
jgi:hypothetical protein